MPTPADLNLTVALPPDQLDALAARVAELLEAGRDDGFLDADGAAEYLGVTRKALYQLAAFRRKPIRGRSVEK